MQIQKRQPCCCARGRFGCIYNGTRQACAGFLVVLVCLVMILSGSPVMARAETRDATIGPEHLAVIVNDADPLSRRIADYYRPTVAFPLCAEYPADAGFLIGDYWRTFTDRKYYW